jgi:hypothetical protein
MAISENNRPIIIFFLENICLFDLNTLSLQENFQTNKNMHYFISNSFYLLLSLLNKKKEMNRVPSCKYEEILTGRRFFNFFQPAGTLRFFQKTFFKKPELSGSSNSHFTANRNFPTHQTINIFLTNKIQQL